MSTHTYHCLFARNYDNKRKKWRDGILTAQETLRFVRVMLYEVIDDSAIGGSPLDVFDLFSHKYDKLSGETISSSRFIVNVGGVKRAVKASATSYSQSVERSLALQAGKSHRRTPTLGIRGAFKKYRVSDENVVSTLTGLPTAICDVSSSTKTPSGGYMNDTSSRKPSDTPTSGVDLLHSHGNKCTLPDSITSDVNNSAGNRQPRMHHTLTSKSFERSQEINQPIVATDIEPGYSNCKTEEPYPEADIISFPSTVSQPEEPRHVETSTVGEEVSSQSHCSVIRIESQQDNTNTGSYEGDVECSLLAEGTSPTKSSGCDVATVVDSELIDCIESALDHFGEFTDDF
ncbi:hypothetical protein X943_003277 [Babesia divergens]|uniref:5'-3' DNA helicase ZGRF1-like N-terminal domain-containing protein n=1 Tax=Babesia divergens TaxID=32595 RepID=A0AAD9GHS2_BABDI|nr:hypothetical protein X943_003277 [Babesia divergens]